MKSYCVKQKKQTECIPKSETYSKTKNGRTMMKCKCAECGITKTKFVKSNIEKDVDYLTSLDLTNPVERNIAKDINLTYPETDMKFYELMGKHKKYKKETKNEAAKKNMARISALNKKIEQQLLNRNFEKAKRTKVSRSNTALDKKFKQQMLDLDFEKAKRTDLSRSAAANKKFYEMMPDHILALENMKTSPKPFLQKLGKKKIGSKMKRNGFIIVNDGSGNFTIKYKVNGVEKKFMSGNLEKIGETLFQLDKEARAMNRI